MGQSFPAINHGSDAGATILVSLDTRTETLRSSFSGASAPGSPVEGQQWLDTSATPRIPKLYLNLGAGAAWYPVCILGRGFADLNLDPDTADGRAAPFEIKACRVENRASLPAVAAGNKGMLAFLTGDGEVYVADHAISAAWKGLLSVVQPTVSAGSYDSVDVDLDGSNPNDGTNPPTQAAKGLVRGWLFDATNEKRRLHFLVPKNWAGNSDLVLRLGCVLNQAEASGDDIEWGGSWVSVTPGDDAVSKTATAFNGTTAPPTDIGSDSEGIGDGGFHVCDLAIDFDDASNPVTAGDLIAVEINRSALTTVGGVIVVFARLLYRQKPRHERA